jgi:hypothetical protein
VDVLWAPYAPKSEPQTMDELANVVARIPAAVPPRPTAPRTVEIPAPTSGAAAKTNQSDAGISLGSWGHRTQASSDPNKHPTRNRTDRDASLPPKSSSIGLLFSCSIRFFLRFFKHIIGVLQSVNDRTLVYGPDTWKVRPCASGITLSCGNVDEDDRSQDLVQFRLGRESRKEDVAVSISYSIFGHCSGRLVR